MGLCYEALGFGVFRHPDRLSSKSIPYKMAADVSRSSPEPPGIVGLTLTGGGRFGLPPVLVIRCEGCPTLECFCPK